MSQPTPSRYRPGYGNHSQTTTFKVLSRGRLRCVQTGEIVRKKGAEQIRNREFAKLHPRPTLAPLATKLPFITIYAEDGGFHCKKCSTWNWFRISGTCACHWCAARYEVRVLPGSNPARSW